MTREGHDAYKQQGAVGTLHFGYAMLEARALICKSISGRENPGLAKQR